MFIVHADTPNFNSFFHFLCFRNTIHWKFCSMGQTFFHISPENHVDVNCVEKKWAIETKRKIERKIYFDAESMPRFNVKSVLLTIWHNHHHTYRMLCASFLNFRFDSGNEFEATNFPIENKFKLEKLIIPLCHHFNILSYPFLYFHCSFMYPVYHLYHACCGCVYNLWISLFFPNEKTKTIHKNL